MFNCSDCGISFPSAALLSNHRQKFCVQSRVDLSTQRLLQGDGYTKPPFMYQMDGRQPYARRQMTPPGQPTRDVAMLPPIHRGAPNPSSHGAAVVGPGAMRSVSAEPFTGQDARFEGQAPDRAHDWRGPPRAYDNMAPPIPHGGRFATYNVAPHVNHNGPGWGRDEMYRVMEQQQSQINNLASAMQYGSSGYPPQQHPHFISSVHPHPQQGMNGAVIEGRYGLRIFAAEGLLAFHTITDHTPVSIAVRQYYCRRRIGNYLPDLEQRDEWEFSVRRAVAAKRRDGYVNFGRAEYIFNVVTANEVVLVVELLSKGRLIAWAEVMMDSLGDKVRRLRHPPVDIAGALRDLSLRSTTATIGLELFRARWDMFGFDGRDVDIETPPKPQRRRRTPSTSESERERRDHAKAEREREARLAAEAELERLRAEAAMQKEPTPREPTPIPIKEPTPREPTPKTPTPRVPTPPPVKEYCNLYVDQISGVPLNIVCTRVNVHVSVEANSIGDAVSQSYQDPKAQCVSPTFNAGAKCRLTDSSCVVVVLEGIEMKKRVRVTLGHCVIPVRIGSPSGAFRCRVRRGEPNRQQLIPYHDDPLDYLPCMEMHYRLDADKNDNPYSKLQFKFTDEESQLESERQQVPGKRPADLQLTEDQMKKLFRAPVFRGLFDTSFLAPYNKSRGFFINVEDLRQVNRDSKTNPSLYKVVVRLPGHKPFWTHEHDWNADIGTPKFLDDPFIFTNIDFDPFICALFEVYKISATKKYAEGGIPGAKNAKIEQVAWGCAKMFLEPNAVRNGRFMVPLYDGETPVDFLEELEIAPIEGVMIDWVNRVDDPLQYHYHSLLTYAQGDPLRLAEQLEEYQTKPGAKVILVPDRVREKFPIATTDGRQLMHTRRACLDEELDEFVEIINKRFPKEVESL